MRTAFFILGIIALLLPTLVACRRNSGPERVAVAGKVTFRDRPVADGQIRFVAHAGTTAPVTVGPIQNGSYDVSASGGVPVGSHRVEIRAYDPTEPARRGPGAPPRKQLLPAKYNANTQLDITIAPGSREITKDFDLTD
jgi:hypothetical protein